MLSTWPHIPRWYAYGFPAVYILAAAGAVRIARWLASANGSRDTANRFKVSVSPALGLAPGRGRRFAGPEDERVANITSYATRSNQTNFADASLVGIAARAGYTSISIRYDTIRYETEGTLCFWIGNHFCSRLEGA